MGIRTHFFFPRRLHDGGDDFDGVWPAGLRRSVGPGTGTTGQLPPEAKQSNKSMEDFMKNKDATPKK